MVDQVNRNLQLLQAFGDGPLFVRQEGDEFEVDGIQFRCDYAHGSRADRFYIVKQVPHVRQYVDLCQRFEGGVIVELGIAEGGSAALAALVARPSKLVAVDLEPKRLAALDEFIAERDLKDQVRAHYGVDQADREQLGSLVDAELDGEPIDLLFDDASHQLEPTRSSFETLFPRMRPGGIYVIEDWNAEHVWRHGVVRSIQEMSPAERAEAFAGQAKGPQPTEQPRPLSDLVMQLVMLQAIPVDVIASVSINPFDVRVERGPATLDADSFRLDDIVTDYFGYLS